MEFKIADTAYLEEISNGKIDYIRQIVELFMKQTPGDIDILNTHIQNQDWDEVNRQAHYLKPTLIYVGAKDMYQQVLSIEQLAKQREKLDTLPGIIADIQHNLQILYKELDDYLEKLSQ